jgi:hypothetical protein
LRIELPDSVGEEYLKGATLLEIGNKHGVSSKVVRKKLKELQTPLRPRGWHLSEPGRNPTKGVGHTEATKRKLRAATIKQFSESGARERASETQRRLMADGTLSKVSKLEDEVAGYLDELEVPYQRQASIRGPKGSFVACADFKLSSKCILEVQGDYWHVNPAVYPNGPVHPSQERTLANDARKSSALSDLGVVVLYLWESDVKSRGIEAVKEVLSDIRL